jgi:hypothetical protein
MYLVKEKITYEVMDDETYTTIRIFQGYEKDKAALFAQDANNYVANEKSKQRTQITKLEKELEALRATMVS